jgi:hypothetical protein
MRLFRKKSESDKLRKQYDSILKRAFELSKTDRSASDKLYTEADRLMDRIEELEKNES